MLFWNHPGIALEPGKEARGKKMTLRIAILGLAVVLGVSVWSWCRSSESAAQGADPVYAVGEADNCGGGNHDDAARRYRTNQSTHWRQVAYRSHH